MCSDTYRCTKAKEFLSLDSPVYSELRRRNYGVEGEERENVYFVYNLSSPSCRVAKTIILIFVEPLATPLFPPSISL